MGFWTFMTILAVCATVCVLKGARSHCREVDEHTGGDERDMRDLNRGFERMERRIEALETLLMDQAQRRTAHHEWE
jgi:hypothetical protein